MRRAKTRLTLFFSVTSFLFVSALELDAQTFLRGDFNCDGAVGLNDAYYILKSTFIGYVQPCNCPASGDINNDGTIELADSVSLLNHLIMAGPPPQAPYPSCGTAASVLPCAGYPPCPLFKRGDANQDGCVNVGDATFIANYLAGTGPTPACMQAADANDDDAVDIADAAYISAYCGAGGPPPTAPGPLVCGPDPTPGSLTCGSYPANACASGCPNQLAGDCNQDGALDISDSVCLLGYLFLSSPATLPCGDGAKEHPSNGWLLSVNGPVVAASGPLVTSQVPDLNIDLSDPVYILQYLFLGGPAPVQGTSPIYIPECPLNPAVPTCGP